MALRRDSYDAAQERIAAGTWAVDAAAGAIYSTVTGKPLAMRNAAGYVYAQFGPRSARHSVRVHRVIWEAVNGPIPDGLEINHINADKGDNRIGNLETVTPKGNTMHAIALGLRTQPRGAQGYSARLTQRQVDAIRARARHGQTQQSIADTYGVARSQVSKIINRRQWAA